MPGERRHHGARLETHINGKRPVERQTQRSQVRRPITFYHVISVTRTAAETNAVTNTIILNAPCSWLKSHLSHTPIYRHTSENFCRRAYRFTFTFTNIIFVGIERHNVT